MDLQHNLLVSISEISESFLCNLEEVVKLGTQCPPYKKGRTKFNPQDFVARAWNNIQN